VKSFEDSGICLVAGRDVIFCTIRPEMANRLLVPLAARLTEIPIGQSDESDGEELSLFGEECADLLDPSTEARSNQGKASKHVCISDGLVLTMRW
jgi:hypothetical protein